jgi:hypothetical protein
MSDTKDTVNKLSKALVKRKGYAYAAGYLESTLVDLIERYVPEDRKVMLKIEMMATACELVLDSKSDASEA